MLLPSSALLAASWLLHYPLSPAIPLFSSSTMVVTLNLLIENRLSCQNLDIELKSLAGAGGTGRVYKANSKVINSRGVFYESVAVKVALPNTKPRLQNECEILQHLERNHVNHVEKCIASCAVDISSANRDLADFATVLYPFESPSSADSKIVSSIAVIPSRKVAIIAASQLLKTAIDTILAGVVVTDLQFLADTVSGDVLLIDFTEAQKIEIDNLRYLDKQGIQSFLSEALAFIPESIKDEVFLRARESISKIQIVFPFLRELFIYGIIILSE